MRKFTAESGFYFQCSLVYRRPILLLDFRIRLLIHDYPTVPR